MAWTLAVWSEDVYTLISKNSGLLGIMQHKIKSKLCLHWRKRNWWRYRRFRWYYRNILRKAFKFSLYDFLTRPLLVPYHLRRPPISYSIFRFLLLIYFTLVFFRQKSISKESASWAFVNAGTVALYRKSHYISRLILQNAARLTRKAGTLSSTRNIWTW